jgi:type IV pilus assembly protein PilO
MATSGAMADFTRLPTQQKVLLFIVVGLALGAVYFQFVYKSLNQSLADAQQEHDQKNGMNKKLGEEIPEFETLKAKQVDLQREINANAKALPTETELPAFFETINRKLLDSGVELIRTSKRPEESLEGFVKVPVEVEVQGTYLQIKRFFASLAQHDLSHDDADADDRDRIISIENLALTTPTVRNGAVILDAKFIAATFRLEEPVAPAGSGAPGAGSAAKPAAGPASAPMPASAPLPTNTPAGAKASVEKSVQAGDTRNRNATNVEEAKTPAGSGSGADRLKGGM